MSERDAKTGEGEAGRAGFAPELLLLNNDHAEALSFLEGEHLDRMVERAFRAEAIEDKAFLIAFDQDADYHSPNFLWFRERYPRFVYVDRVVVAPDARGRGLARQLYEALFSAALDAGHERVVCEINVDPPNVGSDAFHERLGFAEVGGATIHDGAKRVRYLERRLSA